VLVVCPYPLISGSVIAARPVGVLLMEDEGGQDEKIIAVPVSKLTPLYDHVKSHEDLPKSLMSQIQHFFEHYKDLEKGKWVKVLGWQGVEEATKELKDGIANYKP
jgi:inorganic pyrophosphatase